MASYRGIEKKDFLQSVEQGLGLLEKFPTGAQCQKAIAEIRKTDSVSGLSSLDRIANATTDEELLSAIRQCPVVPFFLAMREVLQLHAMNNTDGVGTQVFENISRWISFSTATRLLNYTPLDEESQCWLLCRYAGQIATKVEAPSFKLKEKFLLAVASFFDREGAAEMREGQNLLQQAVALARKDKTGQAVAEFFLALELYERNTVLDAAFLATTKTPFVLDDKGVIGRYGVVLDALQEGKAGWHDPAVQALRQQVEEVLKPYWAADEVTMTGVGFIMPFNFGKDAPQGVMFDASRRAAEAVAKALPDHRVIDGKDGRVVSVAQTPPSNPASRKANSPAP